MTLSLSYKLLQEKRRAWKACLTFALALWLPLVASAQIEALDKLMNEARAYSVAKDYEKSNQSYEQLLEMIKPVDNGSLAAKIKGMMALNYINMGVPLLKEGKYSESKPHFEKALTYSADDPKILTAANSWMANWYSSYALNLRAGDSDLLTSEQYSRQAESYYEKAGDTLKSLKEKVSRADVLSKLARHDDAIGLYRTVISACEGKPDRRAVHGLALGGLGSLEMEMEDYNSALTHLEASFNINVEHNPKMAYVVADKLQRLYETHLPDASKAEFWRNRKEPLR